jgi:hypothetical protein
VLGGGEACEHEYAAADDAADAECDERWNAERPLQSLVRRLPLIRGNRLGR